MLINRITGATRILAKNQPQYLQLPIRDEPTDSGNAMVSSWQLTPDELERLSQGAPLYLRIMGIVHPPVLLFVGDPTEET